MQDYEKIIKSKKHKKPLSKSAKQGLIVFTILFAISVFFIIQQTLLSPRAAAIVPKIHTSKPTPLINENSTSSFSFNTNASIAVLSIEGVIQNENESYNQKWLLDTIEHLTYDKSNAAILLYIDSPGGGVYQSDDVYLALEEYKEVSEKPIWAYFGPLAASGGYYIGCAADVIYANRNTLTGSIGVISSSSFDLTGLMEGLGIKMTTITAGRNKNMMNVNSPMTEEQRAIMQSIADEAYDQFTEIVANSRQMELKQVQKLADGRIYTATQAKENGLIDFVASLEDAITDMEINLFDGKNVHTVYYHYEADKTLSNYLFDITSAIKGLGESKEAMSINAIQSSIGLPTGMEYPAYYFHQ